MAYQPRSAWTTEPNRAVAIKQKQNHLTWHYPGFGNASIRTAGWDHAQCLRQIKAWDRMHRNRGSKAIEYNYFACPHGHLIEGRGNRQNAANGKSAANRAGQSCQVLVGDTEPLSAGHLRAMTACAQRVESLHPGITGTQYGHRHWVSTSCPGSAVMSAIPIRPGKRVETAPTPEAKADPERPWLTSARVAGMAGDQVRTVQAALGVTIDGKYGDATGTAVRALQEAVGLTADGIYGPTTEEAMTTLDDISKKLDQLSGGRAREADDRVLGFLQQRRDGEGVPARAFDNLDGGYLLGRVSGQLAGLTEAVQQLAAGRDIDPKAITDAARAGAVQGVTDALQAITADVTVTVQGD